MGSTIAIPVTMLLGILTSVQTVLRLRIVIRFLLFWLWGKLYLAYQKISDNIDHSTE
jgi:hypothetical protein